MYNMTDYTSLKYIGLLKYLDKPASYHFSYQIKSLNKVINVRKHVEK